MYKVYVHPEYAAGDTLYILKIVDVQYGKGFVTLSCVSAPVSSNKCETESEMRLRRLPGGHWVLSGVGVPPLLRRNNRALCSMGSGGGGGDVAALAPKLDVNTRHEAPATRPTPAPIHL